EAFGSTSDATRVSAFASWIDQTVAGPFLPHDLVLDLDDQPVGNDNVPDTIVMFVGGWGSAHPSVRLEVNGQVVHEGPAAALRSFTLRGSGDQDTIEVRATVPGLPVTIDGAGGADTFKLGAGGLLDSIVTPVTVHGGSGADNLHVDNNQSGFGDTFR